MVNKEKRRETIGVCLTIAMVLIFSSVVLLVIKINDVGTLYDEGFRILNETMQNYTGPPEYFLINNTFLNVANPTCENPEFIDKIAKGVSLSHAYIRNVFDCTEFSKTFVEIFKSLGCSARIATGSMDGMWHDFAVINASWIPKGFLIVESTPCKKCISNYSTDCCWDVSQGAGIVYDDWNYKPMCETDWNSTVLGDCYMEVRDNFSYDGSLKI